MLNFTDNGQKEQNKKCSFQREKLVHFGPLELGRQNFNIAWIKKGKLLSDPGVPGVRSMGPDVSQSLTDVLQT